MYYPVPGHSHLQVLVPHGSFPHAGHDTTPDHSTHQRPRPRGAWEPGRVTPKASPLVQVALDAAFGIREVEALQRGKFHRRVRLHIAARRRSHAEAGPVRITSFHTRDDGESFGTVIARGRTYGFAARLQDGRLTSFKVL